MLCAEPFDVELDEDSGFDVDFDDEGSFDVELGEIQSGGGGEPYTGPYDISPAQSAQTLHTSGLTCISDIVVQAIPSCYGLITYTGFELTVS